MDSKWFMIAGAAALSAIAVSGAISSYGRYMAKRDIIMACYAAQRPDCDRLWQMVLQ